MPWQIVIFIVAAVLQFALRPRQKAPTAAQLGDINIPTIQQGTEVPVVFGDVWIDNWMVCWYGDLSTQPIKQKNKK